MASRCLDWGANPARSLSPSIAALMLIASVWTRPVLAQDASGEAMDAFDRGTKAYTEQRFREAALAFEEAHRILPQAATIYNAGVAWQSAGEGARAADAFDAALAMGELAAGLASDASTRLKALAVSLGHLTVDAPDGTTVSVGHVQASAPLRVYLAPGEHVIKSVHRDGRTTTAIVRVSAGAETTVVIAPATKAASPAPVPVSPRATPVVETSAGGRGLQTWGLIGIGAGAALAGTAIYLGSRALSARDEFYDSGLTSQDAHDRAASLRTWTNVSWGAAGVASAAGAVLLLIAPSRATPRRAHVDLAPVGAGLAVRGEF